MRRSASSPPSAPCSAASRVTFLAVVLSHSDTRRRVQAAVALSVAAAVCFFVGALGWSLCSVRVAGAAADGATAAQVARTVDSLGSLHSGLSFALVLGAALLFAILGLCGWLRSHRLGWLTSGLALLGAGAVWAILREFLIVRITRG